MPAPLIVLALIAVAAAGVRWTVVRADRTIREELVSQARLVSPALSLDRIKSLSGTRADLASHSYRKLKEALIRTRRANEKYRFVYLMGRRPDGRVFFFLDSEPDGSQEWSAPGDVYDEASPQLRGVFDSRREIVEGPSSDKWGRWVSVLVPITDPVRNKVVAVLGIDIDADVWAWDVAARSAFPAGVLLLALFALGAFAVSKRSAESRPRPLTRRLVPPLTLIIVALVFGTGAIVWQHEHNSVACDARNELAAASDEFGVRINRQTSALRAILAAFAEDSRVQRFLKNRASQGWEGQWRSQFNRLSREFAVKEIVFATRSGEVLFSAQAPGTRCDPAHSAALARARAIRAPAAGLEVAGDGMLLLKAAVPVYLHGSLAGYVQIGKDMRDVLQNVHLNPRTEILAVADKKRLDRRSWAGYTLLLGLPASWNQMSNSAPIYTSLDSIPAALTQMADRGYLENSAYGATREIAGGGMDWLVSTQPLRDALGRRVGDLLIIRDVGAHKAALVKMLEVAAPAAGLISVVLLAFVYLLVRNADRSLRSKEQELRKARDQLSATLQSIGDGVISTDASGRVVSLNLAAARLTGWKRKEAVGRPVTEVFTALVSETGEAAENLVEQVLRADAPAASARPITLVSRDGSKHDVAAHSSPIHDEKSGVIGTVLVFRDTSRERRMQRLTDVRLALMDYAESHTLDQLLARALDDICAVVDSPIGFYHFVGPDQRTLTLQQWSTKTLQDFCRAEGRGMHYPVEQAGVWADALREKKPVIHNDYDSLPDKKGLPPGHAKVVREMVVPVIRDNLIVALLGVGNKPVDYTQEDLEAAAFLADVTWEIVSRKRAEEALAASEEYYRSLFDQSRDAIVLLSTDEWRFISANPAAVELFGASSVEDLVSRPFADTSPEMQPDGTPTAEKARQIIEIVLKEGTHFFEWTHKRINGDEFPTQVVLSRIVTGGRTIFQGTVRDISQQRQAQNKLIEAQRELAAANTELKKALKKANTFAEEVTRKSLELNFRANHDSLTGLPNRSRLDQSLADLIAECGGRRSRSPVVMFVDLDRFKLVNDTLGHTVGDAVLVEVASRLRNCLRSKDLLARISGDEFVAVLHSVQNRREAESVALRIIDLISRPIDVNGNRLVMGATVGIAAYPSDGRDPATLIRHADAAMYAAKKSASGKLRWYSGEIDSSNQMRLQMEQEMRVALAREQFKVYYQPIVGIRNEDFLAVEALLRWEHPEKGIISPGLFIPVAEETGEIARMGEFVLRTACGQLAAWRRAGVPIERVGVNVSVAQLKDAVGWLSFVREAIEASNLDPALLELEVTESDCAGLRDHLGDVLEQAHRLGVRIAIDDFGVGHSSLGRFKDIPLAHLKIDGTFVREVRYSERDVSIIRHIVRMAHEQGIEVTGEWVETESQYEILQDCGCDCAQGYLISPPLTAEDLLQFARRRFQSRRRAA